MFSADVNLKPDLEAGSKPHLSQARWLAAASDSCDSVDPEVESVTETLAIELEEFTGSAAATTTGAVGSEPNVITESVNVVEGMSSVQLS